MASGSADTSVGDVSSCVAEHSGDMDSSTDGGCAVHCDNLGAAVVKGDYGIEPTRELSTQDWDLSKTMSNVEQALKRFQEATTERGRPLPRVNGAKGPAVLRVVDGFAMPCTECLSTHGRGYGRLIWSGADVVAHLGPMEHAKQCGHCGTDMKDTTRGISGLNYVICPCVDWPAG